MAHGQVIAVLLLCLTRGGWAQSATEAEVAVANANNNFGFAWYQILASASSDNILLSPASASIVLAMLANGAAGQTLSEILSGLRLSNDMDQNNIGYKSLIESLAKVQTVNVTLSTANKLYMDEQFEVIQEYQDTLVEYFQSSIEEVNFAGDPDGSRSEINNWVSNATNQKIQELFGEDSITSATVLVLANAIYFKGKWSKQFNSSLTTPEPFYTSTTKSTTVQMMHATDSYRYAETDDFQVVELPYDGDKVSMWVLLPREIDGLQSLEEKLHTINLTSINSTMRSQKVELSFPKFKIERTMPMNENLAQLGMNQMFSDAADFSGISERAVKVSEVIQKTYMEVTEEGTEAAAATGIAGQRITSVGNERLPVVFRADHPFICFIQSRTTGPLLFLGRIQSLQ